MGHYFTNDYTKSEIRDLKVNILGNEFTFLSDNGVFSKSKLDFGTRLLLETIGISKLSGNVLDVGCGYGPIGIVTAKLSDANVTMCDVNKRALHLCEMNAKENCVLKKVEIIESDCYSNIGERKFDSIITNPPIRAGKKIVYEIVINAKEHLKENGTLFIVVRKEQGAKSMIEELKRFYSVEILDRSKGFFIIKCDLVLTN